MGLLQDYLGVVGGRWFLVNALLAASVVAIRVSRANDVMPWASQHGRGLRQREIEMLSMLGVVVGVKARKITSELEMYSTVFKFCHLTNGAILALLDITALLAYICVLMVAAVIAPEMADTRKSNVVELKPATLEQWLAQDGLDAAMNDGVVRYALVELMTMWSPPSQFFAPEFAALSLKYQTPGLRFGKVDVEKYKLVAKTYGVDINATSAQIPTVILFKNGKEVARVPSVDKNSVVERIKLSAGLVEDTLELQKALAELSASGRVEAAAAAAEKSEGGSKKKR